MNTINWDDSSWKHLSLIGDEEVTSLLHEREPKVKHCMGGKIEVVQKFTRIQSFGHN